MKPLVADDPKIPELSGNADIWTADEVAQYFRCTARHITNLAKRGEIPATRLGNIWRFKRQDIVAFR